MSMQREREGRGEIFHSGDQFGAFRGFGSFGSRRSIFPSLFGGRDPFDDPFFSRPFGSLFESSISGPPSSSSNKMETNPSKGIVIEELDDDDDQGHEDEAPGDDKDNRQKHSASSIEPSIEHPDDDVKEGKSKVTCKKLEGSQPQNRSYSIQTCKVTYGGIDGAYYTSSRTRRAGHDGVLIEEAKEADKTTGQATHRISRGIQDKGHSLTRKLNADGKVDTMQILHNLEEEELAGFEEAWDFNVKGHFSRSKDAFGTHGNAGSSSSEHKGGAKGWLLSHSEQVPKARGTGMEKEAGTNSGRTKKVDVLRTILDALRRAQATQELHASRTNESMPAVCRRVSSALQWSLPRVSTVLISESAEAACHVARSGSSERVIRAPRKPSQPIPLRQLSDPRLSLCQRAATCRVPVGSASSLATCRFIIGQRCFLSQPSIFKLDRTVQIYSELILTLKHYHTRGEPI